MIKILSYSNYVWGTTFVIIMTVSSLINSQLWVLRLMPLMALTLLCGAFSLYLYPHRKNDKKRWFTKLVTPRWLVWLPILTLLAFIVYLLSFYLEVPLSAVPTRIPSFAFCICIFILTQYHIVA